MNTLKNNQEKKLGTIDYLKRLGGEIKEMLIPRGHRVPITNTGFTLFIGETLENKKEGMRPLAAEMISESDRHITYRVSYEDGIDRDMDVKKVRYDGRR